MMLNRLLSIVLILHLLTLTACSSATPTPLPTAPPSTAGQTAEGRVADLLAQMTLAEKIGQMTQAEKGSISPADVKTYFIGSVLSGGGGSPNANTAAEWAKMTDGYQQAALQTRLAIPLIYGVDAVHGHNNLYGATIFPHNIGLGATGDADLVQRIGRATAEEMAATGIWWDFAPVIAVPQDIRWGRTYEGYSENTDLVSKLGVAYLRGLQGDSLSDPLSVLATPKHFIGDGGTAFGSSTTNGMGKQYLLDQGDTRMDEATLRRLFLPPYQAAIEAGAQSIMVSFSSWNGTKMHAQKHLLTEVLKGELGFSGFLVSDWQAVNQIDANYYQSVVIAINAGIDMVMVPYDYKGFISTLTKAVEKGDVSQARIDDAVRRILTVKVNMGLFEHPLSDPKNLAFVGSAEHRALAREAVQKSLVLLKNDNATLPLAKTAPVIFVGGFAADDIGIQSGGWTIDWQGKTGDATKGTSLLDGIKATATGRVEYDRNGKFENLNLIADVGIAVIGESPYAEGVGDAASLNLSIADQALLGRMRATSKKLVVIVISGRPVILTNALPQMDALVAAWLPGTEGQGVSDGLFGDTPFTGKLPYTWPRSYDQLPTPKCAEALFPFGYNVAENVTKLCATP